MNCFFSYLFFVSSFLLSACASHHSDMIPHQYKRTSGTKRPYKIRGVWYYPQHHYSYSEQGHASWYGPGFHGRRTATGDVFDMNRSSAAHKTLPLPCVVAVTNLENGRILKLVVNDRGPFVDPKKRIIDLSRKAAQILGLHQKGIARVRVQCLKKQSEKLRRTGVWP